MQFKKARIVSLSGGIESLEKEPHMTTSAAIPTVRSLDDASALDGTASDLLVQMSVESAPTGAVPAYRDEQNVWQYVAPSQVDFFRKQRSVDVITVYVD